MNSIEVVDYNPSNIGNIPQDGLIRRYDFATENDFTCKVSGKVAVGSVKHANTKLGHVIDFRDEGQYLDFDNYMGSEVFGTGNFCISLWVSMRDPQRGDGLLLKQWNHSSEKNNSFYFTYQYITNYESSVNKGYVGYSFARDGNLRHLLVNVDNNNTEIYIDGELNAKGLVDYDFNYTDLRMGSFTGGYDGLGGFSGFVKLFRIYNRPLTKDEILKLRRELGTRVLSYTDSTKTYSLNKLTSLVKPTNSNRCVTFSEFKPYLYPLDFFKDTSEGVGAFGFITGTIYERINGVLHPAVKKVFLYHQATGKLVGTTWSNTKGEYFFKNLSLESTFMVVSIDDKQQFGLEGVAYKKATEVKLDGLRLQYPIIK